MSLDKNYQGTDADLETSLEEYGFVARPIKVDYEDEYFVIYKMGDNQYGSGHIRESELDAIVNGSEWASEEDVASMLDTIGATKEEWFKLSFTHKFSDLVSYWGTENIIGTDYYPNDKKWAFEEIGLESDSNDFEIGGRVDNCIEYIKNSESIKNNGYYLHIDNMNNYVGSDTVNIPKIDSLCLITFNSGGQKNLKVVDTINSILLASEIAKLLNIDIEMARIIVYEQTTYSKQFTMDMLDGIKNKNIIVADRDTIVCTNLSMQFADGGEAKKLGVVKVIFENPEYNYTTNVAVNVTEEEARKYFVGEMVNVGVYPKENMQKIIDIEFSKSKDNYADSGDVNYAGGGSVKGIKKKAEKLLEERISYRWKNTDMGSGWLFQLESPLDRSVFNLLEEELYLDEFSPDDMGIEDYDNLSKEEQDYYYEDWKEELLQSTFENFKEKCMKHLDDFIEYIQQAKEYQDGGGVEQKVYNEQFGIGKSKYVVNYYDGVEKHKDGSAFFKIAIFKNITDKNKFINNLKSKGYNMKYAKGGMLGTDARLEYVTDAYASDSLQEELKEKLGIETDSLGDNYVISFAYTDYGGDFMDKVAIAYFKENYPDNTLVETAGYNGENAYVFGEPAKEWIETTQDYPLGFEDIEDFYYEKQSEQENEDFNYFLDEIKSDYSFDKDEALEWLGENRGGYFGMTTQGLDFSYEDLTNDLVNDGVIKPNEEDEDEFAKGGGVGYYNGMTKEDIISKSVVYDNPETFDRYTVFTPDGSVFGMSENASGFNQYVGEDSEIQKGKHLGRKLKSVPTGIEWAILDRMKEEYADGGGVGKLKLLSDKFTEVGYNSYARNFGVVQVDGKNINILVSAVIHESDNEEFEDKPYEWYIELFAYPQFWSDEYAENIKDMVGDDTINPRSLEYLYDAQSYGYGLPLSTYADDVRFSTTQDAIDFLNNEDKGVNEDISGLGMLSGFHFDKQYNRIGDTGWSLLYKQIGANEEEYARGGGIKSDYYIFEGFDHFNSIPLYQVNSSSENDNEYVGEWHTDKSDAEKELESLNENYAKGGGVGNLSYEKIYEVLKENIDESIDDLGRTYENSSHLTGEEVEHKFRDGFIPYTNGGYELSWYEYVSTLNSTGYTLPTEKLQAEMQRHVDYSYELAKDTFKETYPEIVEVVGEDNIDYNSLDEAGFTDEAQELSDWEMEYLSDEDTIRCSIIAYYYEPTNEKGQDGKHTISLQGDINLEAPYHRKGKNDDFTEVIFTFDSMEELKSKLEDGLKNVIDWFNGSKPTGSDDDTFAKGGKAKPKAPKMVRTQFEEGEYEYAKGGGVDGSDNYKNVFNHLKKIKVYGKQGNSKSISDYLSVYSSPKNVVFFGSDNGSYSCEVDVLLKSNSKKELIENSVFQGLLDDEFYTDDNDDFAKGGEIDNMSDSEVEAEFENLVKMEIVASDIDEDNYEEALNSSISEKRAYLIKNEREYAKGGGVRKSLFGNREYSYRRNWTNDHRHHNKSENYEVPMSKRKRKYAEGGKINDWKNAKIGDSARVLSENKMGLIIKDYGRKFHLKFVNGSEKTYDASELEFYKFEEEFAKGGGVGEDVSKSLYVEEFYGADGEILGYTIRDKFNPTGKYTLSSKKERAEENRKYLIDNPSRLAYYRKNEYSKGGGVGIDSTFESENDSLNTFKGYNDYFIIEFNGKIIHSVKTKSQHLKKLNELVDKYNLTEIKQKNSEFSNGGGVRISVLNELYNLKDKGVTQVQLNGFSENIGYVIGLNLDDSDIEKVDENSYITLYKKGGQLEEQEDKELLDDLRRYIYEHRHTKGITAEIIDKTKKGFKVKQIDEYGWGNEKKKTPRTTTAFYTEKEFSDLFKIKWLKDGYSDGGGVGNTARTYDGINALRSYQKNEIEDIQEYIADNGTIIEFVSMNDRDSSSGMTFAVTINGRGIYADRYREDAMEFYKDEIAKYKNNYKYANGGGVDDADWIEESLIDLQNEVDMDDLVVENSNNNHYTASNGDAEFEVFETEDDARERAIERVKEDLEENPEYFSKDWLMNYIDGEDFFTEVYNEWNESYANDIESEDSDKYANRLIEEMVENGIVSSEEAKEDGFDAEDYKDAFVELMTSNQMWEDNGLEHYIDNFGEEQAFKVVSDNNLIDIDKASESAVDTDGVAHFLSSYDGEQIDLSNGHVAYRTN